jgi:hypothetical protein
VPWFKKGLYGQETIQPGYRPGNPAKHQDKFTCEIFDGPRTASAPEYWTYQLRVRDGILAAAQKNKSNPRTDPVIWVHPDGSRQPLAMAWPEMQGAWWEDWAGVYVLRQMMFINNSAPYKPNRLPLLHPDGSLEHLSLSEKYYRRMHSSLVALTRLGVVVTNNAIWSGGLIPSKFESGAYLMRDDKVVRLVDWLVGNERAGFDNTHRGLAISPDGCKLAFKHGEGERRKAKHTIKMIDLCQGG